MHPVFQKITEMARVELREALSQEPDAFRGWDADSFEQEVREFTRGLGHTSLQLWAEPRVKQAEEQTAFCSCKRRFQHRKYKDIWWLTTFGRVEVEESYFFCPHCHRGDRPFQHLTGLHCRGKSQALQRALTDFGAEKSFDQASKQLLEHYGVELHSSSIRQVVEGQAERAEKFVAAKFQEAIQEYVNEDGLRKGEPWLIVETDGSKVRTGRLFPKPEGEPTAKRQLPKHWRET